MFNFLNKRGYVQSVAQNMTPKLRAKFWKSNVYLFQDNSLVLSEVQRSDDQYCKSVSNGMPLPDSTVWPLREIDRIQYSKYCV
ncbi:hypothetical protein VCRA2119O147_550006 [Vibrio crassostreae]|nr:hypothetical protein VCRA2118O144_420013 [Vibrio crassostreae]CAK2119078.1 hypothetical protein VCRA2119O145_470004 [Vibrio crassostreae]CAK2363938.1 hypothetical protein VCRA2117O142_420026 [Vibrio crassostreae]CAK2365456.1 hypothetical protein VCRA2117O143_460026 [Vibrio crassostreae]CAK2371183.1 hypothetical protein VCRA2119O147_550006 [Vibrio crassostreae]